MNSNQSLRFNRTAREAYGHSIEFEDGHLADRHVGLVAAFIAGILLGLWLG